MTMYVLAIHDNTVGYSQPSEPGDQGPKQHQRQNRDQLCASNGPPTTILTAVQKKAAI